MRTVHNHKCRGGHAFDEVDGKTYCLGRIDCYYEDFVYLDECKKCSRLLDNNVENIERFIVEHLKEHINDEEKTMCEMMTFPNTVEEFMEQYKIVDTEQIYTNGSELVPIFRMKQWFEHKPERKNGEWILQGDKTQKHYGMIEAIYKETGERCYINMDFVVDAFPCEEGVVAYTFDNERGGYVINNKAFQQWQDCGADMRGGDDGEIH